MAFAGDFHVNHGECSLVLLGIGLQFQDDPKIFPGDYEILMFMGRFFGMEIFRHFFFQGYVTFGTTRKVSVGIMASLLRRVLVSIEYGCGSKRTLPLIMEVGNGLTCFSQDHFPLNHDYGRKGKKIANVQTKTNF